MKNKPRIGTIRNSMIVYSLGIILLMTILSLYVLSIMDRYKGQIETMFQQHIYLSQVEDTMVSLDENLLGFLSTKSSTRLNNYIIEVELLEKEMDLVNDKIYNTEDMLMVDIKNLVAAYIDEGNQAISYKRLRNVAKYYNHYENTIRIKSYMIQYIDQLNNKQLNRNSKSYSELVGHIGWLQMITYLIITTLILFSLLIVYLITSRMVKPFSNLSYAAEEIAKGNFETPDIVVETEDEFLILANAFNKMKNNISKHVDELTRQVIVESQLREEQLKNIKMEHLLDNAKLYALQSQINPHFLFNTINAGVQMSIMERATKTSHFFQSMSRLFRYNIKKMDSVCNLGDEIENIKDYYDLLKVRFGQRIEFIFNIDPSTTDILVPPLILQPLIENAYIHGLSNLEEGGVITINSFEINGRISIVIKDTGKGMDEDIIDRILNKSRDDYKEAEFGIGIRNVRDRLELFFHKDSDFRIESRRGAGTKIMIELPRN